MMGFFICLESFIDIETDGGRKLVYILVYLYITHSNINKYLFLTGLQVRRCPPWGHHPDFRGESIRGRTGAACSSTEDHPISLRGQTSRPGRNQRKVQKSTHHCASG